MLRNTTIYLPRVLYESIGDACVSGMLREFLRGQEPEAMLSDALSQGTVASLIQSSNEKMRYHLKTDHRTLSSLRLSSAKMGMTISDLASVIIYMTINGAWDGSAVKRKLCGHPGKDYEEAMLELVSAFVGEYDRFNLSSMMIQIRSIQDKMAAASCAEYVDELMGFVADKYGAQRLIEFINSVIDC